MLNRKNKRQKIVLQGSLGSGRFLVRNLAVSWGEGGPGFQALESDPQSPQTHTNTHTYTNTIFLPLSLCVLSMSLLLSLALSVCLSVCLSTTRLSICLSLHDAPPYYQLPPQPSGSPCAPPRSPTPSSSPAAAAPQISADEYLCAQLIPA